VLGGACYVAFGPGYVNHDAAYSLLWGRDIAHAVMPHYRLVGAPTPHPLSNLVGAVLTPLRGHAQAGLSLLGWLALGALGYATYLVGSRALGSLVGSLGVVITLTRDTVLFHAGLAYLDIPYAALVVGAVAMELRERRRGVPVLLLLAAAGLLRPDAWLLALGYVAYLGQEETTQRRVTLLVLALSAPVAWALADLVVTGDPLYSFVTAQEGTRLLGRPAGAERFVLEGPRSLGQALRPAIAGAAAAGVVLSLVLLRRRVLILCAAVAVLLASSGLLAAGGTPIGARYMLPTIALLSVAAAGALLGWRGLRPGRGRSVWMAVAVALTSATVVLAPSQFRRLRSAHAQVASERTLRNELRRLLAQSPLSPRCGPVTAASPAIIPLIGLATDVPYAAIRTGPELRTSGAGYFVEGSERAQEEIFSRPLPSGRRTFALPLLTRPPGVRLLSESENWRVLARCSGP